MTDIYETIKTVFTDAGVSSYYYDLPSDGFATAYYIRFQRISAHELISHSGIMSYKDRFEFICVGQSIADLEIVKALMKTALYFNDTNFSLVYPIEGSRETQAEGCFTYSKDFYIWYN